MRYDALGSLEGLDGLALSQTNRNEAIADKVSNPLGYQLSNGTENSFEKLKDEKEERWLSTLKLSYNPSIVDIHQLRDLTHLTTLDLAGCSGLGDTFEHAGETYTTGDFLNTFAQNCYNNTGKKLTLNLKGTSITAITKNKIDTAYCTLLSDI